MRKVEWIQFSTWILSGDAESDGVECDSRWRGGNGLEARFDDVFLALSAERIFDEFGFDGT